MARKMSPCKYCSDRVVGCHGVCKDYNDWSLENKAEKKQIEETKNPLVTSSSFIGNARNRGKKYYKK